MTPYSRRLLKVIAATFIAGALLVVVSHVEISGATEERFPWLDYIVEPGRHLGLALLIASVVAFIFEQFVAQERKQEVAQRDEERHEELVKRDRELLEKFKGYREMESFGFRRVYVDRQKVFNEMSSGFIREAQDIRILGICVSLFKEFQTRPHERNPAASAIEFFANRIQSGQRIRTLMLKRSPSEGDLHAYGLQEGDFYYMRERDEDFDPGFWGGRRLRRIANLGVGQWLSILVTLAERTSTISTQERRKILSRIQLREYLALPSLSLYILDDRMYVTPYLYKRHCSDVPAFRIEGKESRLFQEYEAHFTSMWGDRLTTSVVPDEFIELLVQEPIETARLYRDKERLIREADEEQTRVNRDANLDPEYYRYSERAMEALLGSSPTGTQTMERAKGSEGAANQPTATDGSDAAAE